MGQSVLPTDRPCTVPPLPASWQKYVLLLLWFLLVIRYVNSQFFLNTTTRLPRTDVTDHPVRVLPLLPSRVGVQHFRDSLHRDDLHVHLPAPTSHPTLPHQHHLGHVHLLLAHALCEGEHVGTGDEVGEIREQTEKPVDCIAAQDVPLHAAVYRPGEASRQPCAMQCGCVPSESYRLIRVKCYVIYFKS